MQHLERELMKERALKNAYKREFGIDITDEEMAQTMLDKEVANQTEWLLSEDGQEVLRQQTIKDWIGEPTDPQAESDASFKETYSERLRREAKERGE